MSIGPSIDPDKLAEREHIAQQTLLFLGRGGVIQYPTPFDNAEFKETTLMHLRNRAYKAREQQRKR